MRKISCQRTKILNLSQFYRAKMPMNCRRPDKEGLEIRVLLTSFFIPYEKITDIEFESKFSPSITIESSLKNVPSVISLGGVSEKAFPIIKKYLK